MREAEVWEGIEKEKAKERMLSTQNNYTASAMDNVPEQDKGTTRDILAKKINLGSGKTYERASKNIL